MLGGLDLDVTFTLGQELAQLPSCFQRLPPGPECLLCGTALLNQRWVWAMIGRPCGLASLDSGSFSECVAHRFAQRRVVYERVVQRCETRL